MSRTRTLKFLPDHVVEAYIPPIVDRFLEMSGVLGLKREECHVVVLVPCQVHPDPGLDRDEYHFTEHAHIAFDRGFGNPKNWGKPFDRIARSKAARVWHGRYSNEGCPEPRHLFPGETPYRGGVFRHGFAVAVSGFQPHFDEMLAGMIADALKAVAQQEYEESREYKEGKSFLE